MGFGFNLFFIFILIPLSVILLISWIGSKKIIYGKALGLIWLGLVGLVVVSITVRALIDKKVLKKKDFYGKYIIDRDYFSGKNADWQSENFHFEIKDNDSIYLYLTNRGAAIKTYKGTITTLKSYQSERLVIKMEQPTHHIFAGNPTIYRDSWSFYLVFNSPKFGNMFFKKGLWKSQSMID